MSASADPSPVLQPDPEAATGPLPEGVPDPVLCLFGGPVLLVDGRRLSVGPQAQARVLAALAVDAGSAVPTHTLVDRVWDDDVPATARRSLQSHLTRLRRTLTEAGAPVSVERRGSGYALDVDPDLVDVHLFRRLRERAAARDCPPVEAARLLERALSLWAGPALAAVDGNWADRARAALETEAVDAAVTWGRATLAIGDHERVVHRMRGLVTAHPLVEPLVELLIRALHGAGRGAEAVEAYLAARERLVAELGTEPGQPLRELYEAVLRDELPPARPARNAAGGADPVEAGSGTAGSGTAGSGTAGSGTAEVAVPAMPAEVAVRGEPAVSAVPAEVADAGDAPGPGATVIALAVTGSTSGSPTSGSPTSARPGRSSRWWWMAAAAAVTCTAVGVVVSGFGFSGASDRAIAPPSEGVTGSPNSSAPEAIWSPSGAPVAVDDFTAPALDARFWGTYEESRRNGSVWSPSAVQVKGGELQVLGMGREPTGQGNVAGGLCWCRKPSPVRTYGIWEVHAKFDAGAGYGAAIGLWPDGDEADGFMTLARIDLPDRRRAYPVLRGRGEGVKATSGTTVVDDFTDWTTYAIEWRPDFVVIRINGRTIFDSRQGGTAFKVPNRPMFLYVQLIPGPEGPVPGPNSETPDRVVMHVDRVRYFA